MQTTQQQTKRIAIVGLPNTGKSQVFNNLTKQYTLVSNYPMTTIEIKTAKVKIEGQACEIIDTPGFHCLYIHSEEELAVRDFLVSQNPDIIIQCIDSNRLKQSLTLSSDLLELGIPMVISLNAIDETARKGMWIDSRELSRILGIPVIESVAINGLGTDDIKKSLLKAKKGKPPIHYGTLIEEGLLSITSILPEGLQYQRKLSLLLLLNDPFLLNDLQKKYGDKLASQIKQEIKSIQQKFRGHISTLINNKRSKWVDDIFEHVVRKQRLSLGGFSQTFAQLSRHPIFGIPIFLVVVLITYFMVVNVANEIAGWMENFFWLPVESRINTHVTSPFWNEFLIGEYGVLSLGLANALLTVLPILSVFFLVFNTLEDIGYIPNLSVLTKRILDKLGLTGNSIMPLVLGFGCKTMATLTTKSIRSKKEKYISIYLIAFAIPCAAQMGLNMSILGRMGLSAFIITFGTLALVEVGAGLVLNKLIKEDTKSDFIQELPKIRMPNLKAVLKKTYYRLFWFLEEAIPVFIYAALGLFFIDKFGILDIIKNISSPIIKNWLGLPLDMVDALIVCMARHEAAAGMIINMVEDGKLNFIQSIVAVTITTMFVPCFANIVAMIKELGTKTAISMAVTINLSSFLLAGMLNWILIFTIGH